MENFHKKRGAMNKIILLVMLTFSFASGAIVTFCPAGCDTTTPALAIARGNNGDTIQYNSGQDTSWTITSGLQLKLKQLLRSQPGRRNSIRANPSGLKIIDPATDSTYTECINLIFNNSAPSGANFARESQSTTAGRGGCRDSATWFINEGAISASVNCFDFAKSSSAYYYEHNRMVDCRVEGFGSRTFTFDLADTSLMPNFTVTRCVFENSGFLVPHRSTFTYNIVRYDGESSLCGGDASTVAYNFFSNLGGANENVTMDNARGFNGWVIQGNIHDSGSHWKFSLDGARNMTVSNLRFDTTQAAAAYAFGTHSSSRGFDSCYNLTISRCYFKDGYNVAATAYGEGGFHHNWLNLKGLLMLGGTDLMVDSAFFDTLQNCVWMGGVKGTVGPIVIPTTDDTLSGIAITSAVIEGSRYPFLKQRVANPLVVKLAAGDTVGPLLYQTNTIARLTKTYNGFSYACSLSFDYVWSNPVMGDSATVRLYDSTAGGWVQCDSSVNLRSRKRSPVDGSVIGVRDTLAYTGGGPGTAHRFRTVTTSVASGITFYDTSYSWADTTTGGGEADCDSLLRVGHSSTPSTIRDSCRIVCDTADTVLCLFDTDTSSGPFDTTRFLGNGANDTMVLSKTGLVESTDYFTKWIDSVKTTGWLKITTADSISDTLTDTICITVQIDSVINLDGTHDTGFVGDTIRLFANEIKETDSVFLGTTAQTIIARGLDTLRFVVSGTSGAKQLRVKDSCGTWDSTAFFVDAIPQYNLTTSVTGSGSVDPAGTTAHDSGSGFALTATDGVGYDFVEWEILSGTVGIADTLDATTTCTLHTTGSVRAVFAVKQYTADTAYAAHSLITALDGLVADSGASLRFIASVDSGYVGDWPGGTVVAGVPDTLDTVPESNFTLTLAAYAIPVIDSIRNAILRDSTYLQAGRITDIMTIYGHGFGAQGDSSVAYQSGTGNTRFTVIAWSDTQLTVTPSLLSIAGFYRSWIRRNEMVSGTPKSRAYLHKKYYGE
jgi:hypothetical protein